MKKKVPNLITIETSFTPSEQEGVLLFRFNLILKEGFSFPYHDMYTYCSLLLRHHGLENIPELIQDFMYEDGNLIPEIRFELIRFQKLKNEEISQEDLKFFMELWREKVEIRKEIIKKEVRRTNPPGKELQKLGYNTSDYYKRLLELTSEFTDITLLDYFIPIVLTYERLIHIFVKHVEETKFWDGLFKKRTYFTYEDTEIWKLLKMIIRKVDVENIREHFIENSVNVELGRKELCRDYYRGYSNPICFNGDRFILRIDKNGFIKQFFQLID